MANKIYIDIEDDYCNILFSSSYTRKDAINTIANAIKEKLTLDVDPYVLAEVALNALLEEDKNEN